jgi:hypothetical protein
MPSSGIRGHHYVESGGKVKVGGAFAKQSIAAIFKVSPLLEEDGFSVTN